jgi:hypothetical protein
MGSGRLERLAPLSGALFAVLFVVAFLASGDTPGTKSTGEEVISHYKDDGKLLPILIVLLIAAILFVFFSGVLRQSMSTAAGGKGWLAPVAFGGGVIYSIALAIFGMTQIMLIDAADLGQPQVAQALNIVDNDNFFPAGLGLAVVLLATGLHALGSGLFPRWLAWASVVLGVLSLAGPLGFVAFLLFPVWVLVVSILLYRRPVTALAT